MISMMVMTLLSSCVDRTWDCHCGSSWVVLGDTTAVDAGTVVRGTAFGPAPSEVAVNAEVGRRVLITDFGEPLSVDASGAVTCAGVTVDATALARSHADGTCRATLTNAGFRPPPCRDTFPFCGCSLSVTEMSLAALIIIAIRSMKRRRA